MDKYDDYPLAEIEEAVKEHISQGNVVYQKFTCGSCGQRLMVEERNKLYTKGFCTECGSTTEIKKCNYLLMMTGGCS